MEQAPPHGTYARYVSKRFKCREACCRRAEKHYQQQRELDKLAGRPRQVSAIPTVRRIQALMVLGWPQQEIAQRLGRKPSNLPSAGARYPRVRYDFHLAVCALYDELSLVPGPSDRTRRWAAAGGFAGPECWPGDTIDDITVEPSLVTPVVDEVAVERALRGPGVPLTPEERDLALYRMVAAELPVTIIAKHLGMSGATATRAVARVKESA